MIIRQEQMQVFSDHMRRSFQSRMAAHLRQALPGQTSGISEADLRATIAAGIDRAAGYDVTRQADVQIFLEYVIWYGLDFDTAPQTEWAGRILRDKSRNGAEKMYALDLLRRAGGPA